MKRDKLTPLLPLYQRDDKQRGNPTILSNPLDSEKPDRRKNSEIYGPYLLLSCIGIAEYHQDAITEMLSYQIRQRPNARRMLHRLSGFGSANVPLIDAAVDLWVTGHRDQIVQWERYFDLQSGRTGDDGILRHWCTREPFSANYGAWCLGTFLAVADYARTHEHWTLYDKAREHIRQTWIAYTLISIYDLSSRGVPSGIGRNARGQRYDKGKLFDPPVGQRSNTAHVDRATRLMLEGLIFGGVVESSRYGWYDQACWKACIDERLLPREHAQPMIDYLINPTIETARRLAALSTIKIIGKQSVLRWPNVHLVVADEWLNHNTTMIMAWKTDMKTGAAEYAFPFPEGRGFGLKGTARTEISSGQVTAVSDYGKRTLVVPGTPPEYTITIDSNGVNVS